MFLYILQKSCLNVSRRTKNTRTADVVRDPAFKLWGKTTINIFRFKQKYFQLSYISDDAAILDHFSAEIQHSQEINIELRGFLTIGKLYKEYPIWNTRWCFLQGFYLKYWNGPNEEIVCEPLGELDLRHCVKIEIRKETSICPKGRNLYLEFNNNTADTTVTKYYLFADTVEELDHWERNLQKVYDLLERKGFLF